MRTSVRIAALLLGGALFVGCDKDKTAATPPTTPAAGSAATPASTDTSKMMGAVNKAVDKMDGAAKTDAKAAVENIQAKLPTTLPAAPAMPAMPSMPK
jgi:hypothetical protein